MDGKVVQLVQGREKALEGDAPLAMLEKFAAFPQIQVIDLDAAIGSGSNDELVKLLASRALCRVGGGVRSVERARNRSQDFRTATVVVAQRIDHAAVLYDSCPVSFKQFGPRMAKITVSFDINYLIRLWSPSEARQKF